jgi:hypothetical protein
MGHRRRDLHRSEPIEILMMRAVGRLHFQLDRAHLQLYRQIGLVFEEDFYRQDANGQRISLPELFLASIKPRVRVHRDCHAVVFVLRQLRTGGFATGRRRLRYRGARHQQKPRDRERKLHGSACPMRMLQQELCAFRAGDTIIADLRIRKSASGFSMRLRLPRRPGACRYAVVPFRS